MKNKSTFLIIIITLFFMTGCKGNKGGILEIINLTDNDKFYAVVYVGSFSFSEISKKVEAYSSADFQKNVKNIKKNDKGEYTVYDDGLVTYYWWITNEEETIIKSDSGSIFMEDGGKKTISARQ